MPHTLCFETICVENRQLQNLAYHEARLNKTRKDLWGYTDYWNLSELIRMPDDVTAEQHKCRLAYKEEVDNIQWEPYTHRLVKKIQRVYDDHIDYSCKYNNRTALNLLHAQRKAADEILIIKNGMVTDSFYGNVAFFDGNVWHTPSTPLLPGTQRALLLDQDKIKETMIAETDISQYSHIKLFNAMVTWDKAPVLDITVIA